MACCRRALPPLSFGSNKLAPDLFPTSAAGARASHDSTPCEALFLWAWHVFRARVRLTTCASNDFSSGFRRCCLPRSALVSCVTQPLVQPIESREVSVDAAALERHVRTLAVTLHPRSVDNLPNLERAADYVLEQLRATGAETAEQIVEADGKQFRNLIARFGPRDGPLIVIGAHYDSCGDTPGADDNASGVAGLLELARLLAQSPPKHSVELVAYTLEEPPYFRTDSMGSVWHARELRRTNREVRLMLSLEMIGFYRDAPEVPGLSRGGAEAALSRSRAISSASSRHWATSPRRVA